MEALTHAHVFGADSLAWTSMCMLDALGSWAFGMTLHDRDRKPGPPAYVRRVVSAVAARPHKGVIVRTATSPHPRTYFMPEKYNPQSRPTPVGAMVGATEVAFRFRGLLRSAGERGRRDGGVTTRRARAATPGRTLEDATRERSRDTDTTRHNVQ